jgi:hypothetical protein
MFAAMIRSSFAWRNLFSKIVSVMALAPLAVVSIAMTGGCKSVATPDRTCLQVDAKETAGRAAMCAG